MGITRTAASAVAGAAGLARRAAPAYRAVNGARHHHRRQLCPFAVLVILAPLRWWAASVSFPAVIVMCFLGGAAALFRVRRALTRRAEWRYAAGCVAAAAVGLALVNQLGTGSHVANGLWVAGWFGLSLPWWSHHTTRARSVQSSPEPSVAESMTMVERWDTYIRDSNGVLGGGVKHGVKITGPVPFDHGDTYTLEVAPYKQTLAIIQQEAPKIATGLDVPLENLVIEAHPDYPKRPRIVRMQHITQSPIENTVWFDRPRYENGRILLGPYADGIGEAWLRLYEDGKSMWSTTLTGGTGLGKTRLTEIIAITALAMRDAGQHTVIFYMDGQDGASSPCLYENATWSVGPDGAPRMLGALERIATFRNKENRAHRPKAWTGFNPGPERPGIFVIIDEAHMILELPGVAKRLAKLGKMVRKLGIGFLNSAHDYSLETMKEDTWRAALLGGNGLVMNVSSRIQGGLIPGLGIHPFDLPKVAGYGVVVGAKGSDIRTAPFRGRYAPDEEEKASSLAKGEVVTVPTIDEWFQRYPALELDPRAARVAGDDYLKRHQIALAEREALQRDIDDLDSAGDADFDRELTELVAERGAGDSGGGDGQWTCARRIKTMGNTFAPDGETVASVLKKLPPGTNLSTARKALDSLAAAEDGFLTKDTQGKFAVYRLREGRS